MMHLESQVEYLTLDNETLASQVANLKQQVFELSNQLRSQHS